MSYEFGILLQGKVTSWTKHIIIEYQKKFPNSQILLCTWTNEDIEEILCDVVQIDPPEPTKPHESNINFQIIGAQSGLKNMKSKIVLKCKTDQFIHNKNIFDIYKNKCSPNKIMITDLVTYDKEYRTSDFCQIGTKQILEQFWNANPLYDGSFPIAPETYLTKNYIINAKKDTRPWKDIMNEYFCIMDFHLDFQIEFVKLYLDSAKQKWFEKTINKNI